MGKLEKINHTICTLQANFLVSFHTQRWHEVGWFGRKPQSFLWPCQLCSPTIKFTHETSRNNISFLDTYITCENGIMSTDIYNKPTDTHQYLSPQSCHPQHCTSSIPYSQALRIKRICSNEQTTKNDLGNWNIIWKRGETTMRSLTIVLTEQVVLTEQTSPNIKKGIRTIKCHLSSHTILCSVIYPTSFVNTGQPYKNTHNCAKSSKKHPSWLSGNPEVW